MLDKSVQIASTKETLDDHYNLDISRGTVKRECMTKF